MDRTATEEKQASSPGVSHISLLAALATIKVQKT
jgi:hypothetical protein